MEDLHLDTVPLFWEIWLLVEARNKNVVVRSNAKVEFTTTALEIFKIMWLLRVLKELQINDELPMKFYCDNKEVISIAHNPIQHDRVKYVGIN